MTRTTRNRAAAALATGSTIAANDVSEVSQHIKVAETPNVGATKQANVEASHSKDVQNAQECIDIDSKVDTIVVDHEDNCRALVAALMQDKLNERIKVLEAKKAQVTLEAKLCSLELERAQGYLKANASIGSVTSLKNILVIEHGRVCPDSPKYNGKSIRHYKAYKRTVKYMLGECPFTYCMNKEKCTYARQFLTEIPAKH